MLDAINTGYNEINFLRDLQGMQNSRNRQIESATKQKEAGVIPNPLEGETGVSNKKAVDVSKSDNKQQEKTTSTSSPKAGQKNAGGLTEEEQQEVRELKAIDRKVRQHEMAHLAAAQGIAVSGANFQFKQGPDGINYAVGGDVQIDTSKDKDPQKTIEKARKIIAAANAPADPSAQDRQVAAQAQAMQVQAQQELSRQSQAETNPNQTPIGTTKGEKTQNSTAKEQTGTHPGIKEYQKNQSFASASIYISQPGLKLDLVA